MPSTPPPPNVLLCAQVDTNICRGTSIDAPCMLEKSPNSKDELTDKEYFLVKKTLELIKFVLSSMCSMCRDNFK